MKLLRSGARGIHRYWSYADDDGTGWVFTLSRIYGDPAGYGEVPVDLKISRLAAPCADYDGIMDCATPDIILNHPPQRLPVSFDNMVFQISNYPHSILMSLLGLS